MRALIAFVLLMFFVSPGFAETLGEQHQQHKDWLTACRDDGYCSATAYVKPAKANGTLADYVLRIGRHATETYWEISLTTIAAQADDHLGFTVDVDGAPASNFRAPAEVAAYGSINDFYYLGTGAHGLLDRMVKGKRATFGFKDADGVAHEASFSLAGLGAALIAIDTSQHRIGSERVAEAPPAGLQAVGAAAAPLDSAGAADEEPTSPLPLKAVPPALLAQVNADSACGIKDISVDQISTANLSDGYTLFIVPCTAGPSYTVEKAYLDYSNTFDAVAFPQYLPSVGWTASPLLFNATIDTDALVVTSSYASAKGDCGMSGQWAWTKTPSLYTDHAFKLVQFRAKETCDGKAGEFPLVYPTKP